MLQIVIFDARISLVPKKYWKMNKIKKYIQQYGRVPLLDGAKHQHLLKGIPLEKRKDRPDILHFGLLITLNFAKILNTDVEILFTIGEKVYEVLPETRLPRNQQRFYGMLEQIINGKSKSKFIVEKKQKIEKLLTSPTFVFTSKAKNQFSKFSFNEKKSRGSFVFGGMAHGSINIKKFPFAIPVNLGTKSLELWTAISMAFSHLIKD